MQELALNTLGRRFESYWALILNFFMSMVRSDNQARQEFDI